MASDLRKKTQEAMDVLRDDVDSCQMAMLIDRDTGLVLAKSSASVVPQNKLDQLANSAQTELAGPLLNALTVETKGDEIVTALYVGKDEVIAVVKSLRSNDDALVCQFTAMPNRSALTDAATAVFSITTQAEAA
jgi:hypothetical protein